MMLLDTINLTKDAEYIGSILVFIAYLGGLYLLFCWIVRRARDAGMSKKIAYWTAVPVVQSFTFLVLMLAQTSNVESAMSREVSENRDV